MNTEETAVFIGHRTIYRNILEEVDKAIIEAVENGVNTFLNGGMGHFDIFCVWRFNILQSKYPHIKQYLVLPYRNYKNYDRQLFTKIICPNLDIRNYRLAIPKRNEWMVQNSSYAICYVGDTKGGAAKMYEKAKNNRLKIIDILM
ncbi:MAG: DUF1273 family protein [Eubacteriales bacterium]|nr:DUF1273 family protein [Eubacteriales bacterium]